MTSCSQIVVFYDWKKMPQVLTPMKRALEYKTSKSISQYAERRAASTLLVKA